MFFESGGEDWFYRKRTATEHDALKKRTEISRAEKKVRMEVWVERRALVAAVEVKTEGTPDNTHPAKDQVETDGHPEIDDKGIVGSDAGVNGGDNVSEGSVNGIKHSEDVDMGVSV